MNLLTGKANYGSWLVLV